MTHEEMLKQLGLTDEQFHDLLQKYNNFLKSLDADQLAVMKSSEPPMAQAAASFGPGVSEAELRRLMERFRPHDAISFFCCVLSRKRE